MTIQILPPRLANQIAAGEVVERPSSVVKELVENSIDAGATRIDIDIEKGGAKLIRIRDNGCGVEKAQLGLALSRHATSKLACLDDLEAIMSLGFRGEALASISSVSRLSFTSRTAQQDEAWQAYAEGRDMSIQIKPAAHPIGTTVEVIDLFFNTPARRKFLRTDKTEFNHIDELIRRIALSRFDLQLTLKHNGKVIRSYRPAKTIEQRERRVAAVAGAAFMQTAVAVESEHYGLRLWGWVGLPHTGTPLDVQYSYVNGRMMRDKLINHALRQAYEEAAGMSSAPAYVLFIEVAAKEVDVNVHPAKHEVRFHQARLVHDFIFQAIFKAVVQGQETGASTVMPSSTGAPVAGAAADQVMEPYSHASHGYAHTGETAVAERFTATASGSRESTFPRPSESHRSYSARPYTDRAGATRPAVSAAIRQTPSGQAIQHYDRLLQPQPPTAESVEQSAAGGSQSQCRALSIVADRYLLVQEDPDLQLLDLRAAWQLNCKLQLLALWQQGITAQPLLLPISIKLDKNFVEIANNNKKLLNRLGLELNYANDVTIIVRKVPAQLRQADMTQVLPELLQQLVHLSDQASDSEVAPLCSWLARQGAQVIEVFTWEQATQLLGQVLGLDAALRAQYYPSLFRQLDYASVIKGFNFDATTEKK